MFAWGHVIIFLMLEKPESLGHFKSVAVMTTLPTMRLTSKSTGTPLMVPQSDLVNV